MDPLDPAPAHSPPARPGLVQRAAAGLRAHFALLGNDRLLWFAGLVAAFVLTASRFHASTGEYRRLTRALDSPEGGLFAHAARTLFGDGWLSGALAHATGPIAEYVYWFWTSLLLFFALPMALAALMPGVRVRELGAGVGDWRYGLKAAALLYLVMLPFVVGASFTPTFANHYPLAAQATRSWATLLTYETSYAAYFVGWEFIYRGLLCVALYPRVGPAAIFLHAIPFAVMHGGKPEAEAYGSIIAGLALGVVAVRARSFWYGALLHAAVASTMDALAITQAGRWPKGW